MYDNGRMFKHGYAYMQRVLGGQLRSHFHDNACHKNIEIKDFSCLAWRLHDNAHPNKNTDRKWTKVKHDHRSGAFIKYEGQPHHHLHVNV